MVKAKNHRKIINHHVDAIKLAKSEDAIMLAKAKYMLIWLLNQYQFVK